MTAADRFGPEIPIADGASAHDESVAESIERTCRTLIDARRAGRVLADWLRECGLGEPEFQVLWCLRDVPNDGLDQTNLATRLAYSTAQVSATVERLGSRGWICQHARPGDRRRHVWQLSASGRSLLQSILLKQPTCIQASAAGVQRREAAA